MTLTEDGNEILFKEELQSGVQGTPEVSNGTLLWTEATSDSNKEK